MITHSIGFWKLIMARILPSSCFIHCMIVRYSVNNVPIILVTLSCVQFHQWNGSIHGICIIPWLWLVLGVKFELILWHDFYQVLDHWYPVIWSLIYHIPPVFFLLFFFSFSFFGQFFSVFIHLTGRQVAGVPQGEMLRWLLFHAWQWLVTSSKSLPLVNLAIGVEQCHICEWPLVIILLYSITPVVALLFLVNWFVSCNKQGHGATFEDDLSGLTCMCRQGLFLWTFSLLGYRTSSSNLKDLPCLCTKSNPHVLLVAVVNNNLLKCSRQSTWCLSLTRYLGLFEEMRGCGIMDSV